MTPLLRTWMLIPTAMQSSSWSLSTFRGPVYVRAEGPGQARGLAAQEFRKYFDSIAQGINSPWLDEDLVRCVEMTDDDRYARIDRCVLFA